MHQEVLGLDDPPLEVLVLDLVLTEVLLGVEPCPAEHYRSDSKTAKSHLSCSCWLTGTVSASLQRRSSW
jgi:hypothetical protein